MRPSQIALLLSAAALLWHAGANPAAAAWNNVFQVCCHNPCQPAVSYYAPVPCPQPVVTTQYVQRSYYQPVTTYQTRTYYEPVTSYQTSYYYEPVSSYRYSCYYDPCTCSYQQVAVPTTSYRLRAQSCPVTSWVQRCASVPVTTYQQAYYYEPVTTCTSAPVAAPIPATPAPPPAAAGTPGVSEQRLPAVPGVSEQPGRGTGTTNDRNFFGPPGPLPPTSGSNLRPWQPAPTKPSVAPPIVRLDKIVALPPAATNVEGHVYHGNNVPQVGARLLFVHAARPGARQTATADGHGQFRVALAAGEWLVYLPGADGQPMFHSKLDVREKEARRVTLVSR